MRYSVYNYTTRQYDYYDGSGPDGAHAGTPKISPVRSSLGATPEQAAWPVPGDATFLGSGDLPQGRIGVLDKGPDLTTVAVLGAGAFILWRILR